MSTDIDYKASKRSSRFSSGPPQPVVIQATPRGQSMRMSMGPGSTTMMRTTNVRSGGYAGSALPSGELASLSKHSVQAVKDTRTNEKKDLNDLNTKLASHLEKTKFMEGMNKQLKMELDKIKALKMFDDTKLKELIGDEIDELKKTIKDLNERCAALQAENLKLKDKVDTSVEDLMILRKQRDELNEDKEKLCRINADLEGDIAKLRKEIEFADNKRKMALEELAGCRDDVVRLQDDLQAAQEEQINLSDQLNALREDYDFNMEVKEQECEELKKLVRQLQAMEPDYSKMWKGQFAESLQKLQAENEERINRSMADLQRSYELKINRLQSQIKRDEPDGIQKAETKTLKSEMGTLNSKLGNLENENNMLKRQLEDLMRQYKQQCEDCEREKDDLRHQLEVEKCNKNEIQADLEELEREKGTLDKEIHTYRVLLDQGFSNAMAEQGGFQSAGGAMIADAMLGGGGGGGRGGSSSQSSNPKSGDPAKKQPVDKTPKKKPEVTSETTGKMVMKKMFSGDLVIEECAPDGSYITIKNKGSSEKDLSKCCIKRQSNRGQAKCQFSKGQKLKPFGKLVVYSERFGDDAGPDDIVVRDGNCKTWGTGSGLCEVEDDDPVTHKQKVVAKLDMQYMS